MSNTVKIILALCATILVFLCGWWSGSANTKRKWNNKLIVLQNELQRMYNKYNNTIKKYEEELQKKDDIIEKQQIKAVLSHLLNSISRIIDIGMM